MSNVVEIDSVDQGVAVLWEEVVVTCNRVLKQADMYGFALMLEPDPNIHQMAKMLEVVICPMLDRLTEQHFSPESGIKVANIRQYSWHLRDISKALDADDECEFQKCIEILREEAMLI